MKRIRALDAPTPGLDNYRQQAGEDGSWQDFRKYNDHAAYRELVAALWTLQHGLCGYCEAKVEPGIGNLDRQVEHVIPKSQDRNHEFDHANLMMCCKGGTWSEPRQTSAEEKEEREEKVVSCGQAKGNLVNPKSLSCGQAKGNLVDPKFLDPRNLPALPALMQVRYDNGEIRADEKACLDASIDVGRVKRTIDILGLNVKRLQTSRKTHWRALSNNYDRYGDSPEHMLEAARMELLPGEDNRLPQFFSTSRSYFGPLAERVLAEAPQAWI